MKTGGNGQNNAAMRGGKVIASWLISRGVKDVVAVRSKPVDTSELGEPPIGSAACQHGDELDCLGDQRTRNGDDGFLDQLLHPAERAER